MLYTLYMLRKENQLGFRTETLPFEKKQINFQCLFSNNLFIFKNVNFVDSGKRSKHSKSHSSRIMSSVQNKNCVFVECVT